VNKVKKQIACKLQKIMPSQGDGKTTMPNDRDSKPCPGDKAMNIMNETIYQEFTQVKQDSITANAQLQM